MQRVTITGVFTIALLSGCAQPAGPRVPTTPVNLQCHVKNKDFGEIHIGLKETDVQFLVAGCNITKFIFVGNGHDPPPNFTETTKAGGPMVVYHYDGKNPIPDTPDTPGYKFTFVNDDKQDGNGSGVVKN